MRVIPDPEKIQWEVEDVQNGNNTGYGFRGADVLSTLHFVICYYFSNNYVEFSSQDYIWVVLSSVNQIAEAPSGGDWVANNDNFSADCGEIDNGIDSVIDVKSCPFILKNN